MERLYHSIVSGERRGIAATSARAALATLEPAYATAARLRNLAYDRGLREVVRLPRPTVSVGNLTVGGTGKTPVVRWLATRLAHRRPAVLLRGYKSAAGLSDEAALLGELLGDAVPVEADPDRAAAAARVLARRPDVGLFLLDDGFQHRRVARAVDLVLIDVTNPFGHGHVLPRGLLREPAAGLRRASAVLLTRCDLADADPVEDRVRSLADAPVFRSRFETTYATPQGEPVDLSGRRVVAACGVGNPAAFFDGVRRRGADVMTELAFPDHHAFKADDAVRIAAAGETAVVTGKDWVKLRDVWPAGAAVVVAEPGAVVEEEDRLIELVSNATSE